jgi:hypothetical protein
MNLQEFESLRNHMRIMRDRIVEKKRPEYTHGREDVLYNFKSVAEECGISPLQSWYTYARKHVASIAQYCKHPALPMSEPISGRIADLMNYLELLQAIIEDLNDEPPNEHE